SLQILSTPDKGRGLYAIRPIAQGTVVEISPVLLFTPEEWEAHGRHTVLDHYTFIWRIPGETRPFMALALGLGSIFNHSSRPNVSFYRNIDAQTIEYTTTRDVSTGEELCISYGDSSRLWFPVVDDNALASESDEGE
ncbi:protein methyltransferase, partial [Dacryopinax primogenitus]